MRLAILVLVLIGSVAVAQPKQKIAILGLEAVAAGAPDKETVRVAQDFTVALRVRPKSGAGPFAVAPNSERELGEEKLLHECLDEASACIAKIGAALAADYLMFGKVELKGSLYQVSVKLFDVAKKKMVIAWADAIPAADANGTKLGELAKKGYEKMVGTSPAKPSPAPPAPPPPPAPPTSGLNPSACDFEGLSTKARNQFAMGNFAAALAGFEQAYKCKADAKLVPMMFMTSCKARNITKAKFYWNKMSVEDQKKYAQICQRHSIDPHQ